MTKTTAQAVTLLAIELLSLRRCNCGRCVVSTTGWQVVGPVYETKSGYESTAFRCHKTAGRITRTGSGLWALTQKT